MEQLGADQPSHEELRRFSEMASLGRQAMEAERKAQDDYETLKTLGSFEAPEDYCIVLSTRQDKNYNSQPLIIEVQDPGYRMPKFNYLRPGSEFYNRCLVQLKGLGSAYIGSTLEIDTRTNKIWVFNSHRTTRAQYNLDTTLSLIEDAYINKARL